MGGSSRSSSTFHNAGDPFGEEVRKLAKDWGDAWVRQQRAKCDAHVRVFQRLNRPHDGHVQAWQAWKARPWGWRNYLAAAINGFINWLEGG